MAVPANYESADFAREYRRKIPERLKLDLKNPPESKTEGNGIKRDFKGYHEYFMRSSFPSVPEDGYVTKHFKDGIMDNPNSILKNRNSYLEIGTGPGNYLKLFGPYFKHVDAVEPSPNMQTEFIEEARKHNWNVFTGIFQDFEPAKGQKYDMIFCSHMLYHVDINLWPKFLERVYDLLEEGGIAIFAMVDDKGQFFDSYMSYDTECPNIAGVTEYFKYRGIPVQTGSEALPVSYDNFRDMYEFIDFCIVEGVVKEYRRFTPEEYAFYRGRCTQYVLDMRNESGNYECVWNNGYAVVQKKTTKRSNL